MKHTLVTLSSCLLIWCQCSIASASTLQEVGSVELRWLLFPLYQVSLKTADGRYQAGRYPQALDIVYRRAIPSQDLVAATDDQWQRLGINTTKREQWLEQLSTLWPSVKTGDRLSFRVDANGENAFYYNGKAIGGISDAEFGPAFLSIWLSPRTSQPALRQRLIGAVATQ